MTGFTSVCSFTKVKSSDCFCWNCIQNRINDDVYKRLDSLEQEIKELKKKND